MKVLIIGGTSSLGFALKIALSQSSDVITAGRKDCDYYMDLNDPLEDIFVPKKVNTVILTAASFGGKSAAEMLEAESVNVLGTLKVCNAAVQAKAELLILVSSIYCCLTENSDYYNIYALSKKHSEDIARLFCSIHSLPLAILRPSQLYGNDDSFRKHQPFIYRMVDDAEKKQDIIIYGSNDASRNYLHIEDLTTVIKKVIQNKVEGTYSCIYPENVTLSKVAKAAHSAFNSNGQINFLNEKNDISDNIFKIDNSLYKKIGFYPKISIEEGMRKISTYRKSHK